MGTFFCQHEYFVPEEGVFPGQNPQRQQNILIPHPFPGQNTTAAAKHPYLGHKTWTKHIAATKYPHLGHKTWTKHAAAAKHPHSGRKSGRKHTATAKHPHLGHKTWTKHTATAKHPHSGRKTWTKHASSSKTSSFRPQNREETVGKKKKGDPPQSRSPFSYL